MAGEVAPFAVLLAALLGAIAIVDARSQRIPDALNLALAAAGAGYQLQSGIEPLLQQAAFALGAVLLFYFVRQAHHRATGVIGLGLGDVKLAGAGAMWFAPVLFPYFLFTASLSALAYALIARVGASSSASWRQRLPFGPFMALGIAVAFGLERM